MKGIKGIALLLTTLAALSGPLFARGSSEKASSVRVVYSIPGLSGPIWTAASDGFIRSAEAKGWNAEILDPNDNLENQISQLDNAILREVDAIVITPIDGQAVSTLMNDAQRAGIPVVAVDRQVTGPSLTTVEADNYLIGQQLGQMYLEALGGARGEVLIVGGPLSSSATVNRTEGFKSVISGNPNIRIVAESATEMDAEVVLNAVTNYLQANPNINCVFSCTDSILPSVLTALSEAGKLHNMGEDGHVNIYSVDGDSFGLEQVVAGTVDATYGLDPYTWASAAVDAIEANMRGEAVEEHILIAGHIVTRENYEQLRSQGLLWGAN